jgi:hypothetical protein
MLKDFLKGMLFRSRHLRLRSCAATSNYGMLLSLYRERQLAA